MGEPQRIAVLGPGLLGGSLVRALAPRPDVRLSVWARRREPLDELRAEFPGIGTGLRLEEVVGDADVIVLATPIGVMPALGAELARLQGFCTQAVVTDVGSVKGPVVRRFASLFSGTPLRFVGSHPMAGSEEAGLDAATSDLFDRAVCILTPDTETDADALKRIHTFWETLGCRVRHLDPQEHDRVVARISHLPHAVASILVQAVLDDSPEIAELSGNGLADTTRVASGEVGMWTEILLENREEVLAAFKVASEKLAELVAYLENMDEDMIHAFLEKAKILRDTRIAGNRDT